MQSTTAARGRPVILTAMQSEYDAVVEAAGGAGDEQWAGPVPFRVLDGGAGSPVVARVGMGHINAALGATALTLGLEPSFVFSCGVAGALAPGLGPGDVVVGADYVNGGADARPLGQEPGGLPGEPARYPGDRDLIEHARLAGAVIGTMLSSDVFVDAKHFARVGRTFPDAITCDMESCAAAQVCFAFGTRFLGVRAISDSAAGTGADEFLRENVRAGLVAARFALALARRLG